MLETNRLLVGIDLKNNVSSSVSTEIRDLLSAACLVESRGDDYGDYLSKIFSSDKEFASKIEVWSKEENDHGMVLSTWLRTLDSSFNYDEIFNTYTKNAPLIYNETKNETSIRGSKSGELISRCVVESGTSTFYLAIADNIEDNLLKEICHRLSRDEINHFKLFKNKLALTRIEEKFTLYDSLKTIFSRLSEAGDHQLTYAYYISKQRLDEKLKYNEKFYSTKITYSMFKLYKFKRIKRVVDLFFSLLDIKSFNKTLNSPFIRFSVAAFGFLYLKMKLLYLWNCIKLNEIKSFLFGEINYESSK